MWDVMSQVWARQQWLESLVFIKELTGSASGSGFIFCFLAVYLPFWLSPPLNTSLARSRCLTWVPWLSSSWLQLNQSKILLETTTKGQHLLQTPKCDLVCMRHSQRCQRYCLLILRWLCRQSFALEGWAFSQGYHHYEMTKGIWMGVSHICVQNQDGRLLERRGLCPEIPNQTAQIMLRALDCESEKCSTVLQSGSVATTASVAFQAFQVVCLNSQGVAGSPKETYILKEN